MHVALPTHRHASMPMPTRARALGMRTMRLKAPRAAVLSPYVRVVSRSALQQLCLQVHMQGRGDPLW
jgi:hypothetical protein